MGASVRDSLRFWVAALVMLVLLLPVLSLWLLDQTIDHQTPVWSPEIRWSSLLASLLVAGTASVLAVVAGTLLAFLFTLTDFPRPTVWATICLVPFAAPPIVWSMGQIHCYGPGGLVELALGDGWRPAVSRWNQGHFISTALVLAQIHAPLAMLIVGRALGRIHHAGFESARLHLPRTGLVLWFCRTVWADLSASFLLVMALAMGNFAVPHVLQCRLYSIQIYTRMTNYLDQEGCVWAATPLLAVTLCAAVLLSLSESRRFGVTAEVQRPLKICLGRYRWFAGALLLLLLLANVGLPLFAMLRQCQSPTNFLQAASDALPETENTLVIATAASLLACGAGLVVSFWIAHSRGPLPEILATIPIAVPGLIIGLAYLRFYNRTWPVDLTVLGQGSVLIVLGLGFRGWPFAVRVIANGQRQMAPQWDEAARLSGIRGWRKRVWITIPLVFDQIAAGAVIAFVLAAGDVEISQMLCAPGQGTLALRLFTFLHFGPTHVAASLAILQLAVATTPVLLYYLLFNRCLPFV